MPTDADLLQVDSVVHDLFGLILCARPAEAEALRRLVGLADTLDHSAAEAATLCTALLDRMPQGPGAFARKAVVDGGGVAAAGATQDMLDQALLAMRDQLNSDEGRIALVLAGLRAGIARRARRLGKPVTWPAVLDAAQPTPSWPVASIAAGAGEKLRGGAAAALDMTGLTQLLSAKMEERLAEMGKVNILIAGRSGVGKSTLVNTIFGREVARTGIGRPVTRDIAWYEPEGLPVRLCDTRGLELSRYEETLDALRREIERGIGAGAQERVHVLWLCIAEPSSRIEDAERGILEMCLAHGIQGIVVLTKAFLLEDMTEAAREALPGAAAVVRVQARGEPPQGIIELVQATLRLLEGPARDAFNAAQQVDIEAKRTAALRIAAGAAASAGLAAATPVPLADSAGVLTVNIGMIAGIAVAIDRKSVV